MSHRSAFPKSLHQRPRATSSSSPFFSHLSVASRPHIKRPPIFPPPLRLEFTGNNLLRYFQPLLYSQSSQYFPVPPTFSVPSIFPTFSSILNTDTIIWYPVFVALISPLSSFGVHSLSTGPILSVLPTLPLLLSHPLSIVVYECPIFECSSDIPFLSFCLGLLFFFFFISFLLRFLSFLSSLFRVPTHIHCNIIYIRFNKYICSWNIWHLSNISPRPRKYYPAVLASLPLSSILPHKYRLNSSQCN